MLQTIITVIQLIACVALVLVTVFQSGKNSGLSGALSGSSNRDTFMSRNKEKSLDARLAKATKWIGGVFVLLTLILNLI